MQKNRYDIYIESKEKTIQSAFSKYLKTAHYEPIFKNIKPLHYRHKVTLSALNHQNKVRLGLFVPNTKTIKPQIFDELHDEHINEVMASIETILQANKIMAHDLKTPKGVLKHVMIKKSYAKGDLLVIFVTQTTLFPQHKQIIKDLIKKHPQVKSVVQNIHFKETKFAILDQEKTLYGPGYIEDYIGQLVFKITSQSFYQVNPYVSKSLYETAIEKAEIKTSDIIFDCYSGVGTLTLLIAQKAKLVYGVELNKESHLSALYNKSKNNLSHVRFLNADANQIFKDKKIIPSIVFVDPTRTGLSDDFIKSLLEVKPRKIVYISCNYLTQMRDIQYLSGIYQPKYIQAFDMFSFTNEIETLVILERK